MSQGGSCIVVSLTTGKWKKVSCLQKFPFPCKYREASKGSSTPEPNENEPPLHGTHHRLRSINIEIDHIQFELKFPETLLYWLFGILVLIIGCSYCLCLQFLRCRDKKEEFNYHRNTYPYPNNNERRGGRNRLHSLWSNSNSASSHDRYSSDPSEAIRLLNDSREDRQRALSNFSHHNWVPVSNTVNATPPRSLIFQMPDSSLTPPQERNIEEILALHGHYANFASLTRSEVSSIFERMQMGLPYVSREDRPWDRPPPHPMYFHNENNEIDVALCRNSQSLSPPPDYITTVNNCTNNSSPLQSPTLSLVETPRPPSHFVFDNHLSRVPSFGIPILPPALESDAFASWIRRGQNRQNVNHSEQLLKKQT